MFRKGQKRERSPSQLSGERGNRMLNSGTLSQTSRSPTKIFSSILPPKIRWVSCPEDPRTANPPTAKAPERDQRISAHASGATNKVTDTR